MSRETAGGDQEPQRRARRRRQRLLGWRAVVPLVAALAGVLFGTSARLSGGADLRTKDTTDLADAARNLNRTVERRAATVAALQAEVGELTAKAAPGNRELRDLTARSEQLSTAVGIRPVAGPAVTVALDDAHRTAASLPDGFTADDIVVHQQDVQSVVNALWRGGAEAMQLMDQRVISSSAVRCVGNTLLLQGRVYSPPYTITAVGDVPRMLSELETDPQVSIYRQYVDVLGLGYTVTTAERSSLPAYEGSLGFRYAQVVR
ncbi:MAG TPA: DUF881 domain-containing protein [Dermatophilaceae bacterium]|nr:DUF881 domain-containing protein [Dermatophilaceae bacterium]